MKIVQWLPLMFLIASLIGCEATTFQKPPLTEAGCDPQLVGDWLTVPDPGTNEAPGEGELQIDKTCKLIAIDHKQDKTETKDPTQLHVGHDGTQAYAWVDSAWAFRFAQSDQKAPPGDVTLLRYVIHADELSFSPTDSRAIAHRIIDGDLQGDVRKLDGVLLNRVTGTLTPEELRAKVAFHNDPTRFVRHPTKATK